LAHLEPIMAHDARNNTLAVIIAIIVLAVGAYLSTFTTEVVRAVAVTLFVVAGYGLFLWFLWPRRSKQMAFYLLLAAFTFGGIGLASFAGWIFVARSQNVTPHSSEASAAAIASLAELGWTVKSGLNEIQFQVSGTALPPMEQSAVYFRRLNKPFDLQLGQVIGLNGLHYLSDIPGCTKIEISAGEFTDISELRGFSHLIDLGISQLPLNGYQTVDSAPLASLTNLQVLRLGSTKIRSTTFLSNLKHIKTLNLGQTLITDISALSDLHSLETLEPILEVGIQFEGHGLVRRLSMMRIIARRTKAATVLA